MVLVQDEDAVFHCDYNNQRRNDGGEHGYFIPEQGHQAKGPKYADDHNNGGKNNCFRRSEENQEEQGAHEQSQNNEELEFILQF